MLDYIKRSFSLIVTGIVGLVLFILLLDTFFPHKAANVQTGQSEAIKIATAFLKQHGHKLEEYRVMAVTEYNSGAFFYLQERYGQELAREIFETENYKGLDFYWRVSWYKNLPLSTNYEAYWVWVSGAGNIIAFRYDAPTTMSWPKDKLAHISQDKALTLALAFLEKQGLSLEGYGEPTKNTRKFKHRTDHSFSWLGSYKRDGDIAKKNEAHQVNLYVKVMGGNVGGLEIIFGVPASRLAAINRQQETAIASLMVSIIFIFIFCLAAQIVFLKKYHEGEVGVRTAFVVFFITWLAFVAKAALILRVSGNRVGLNQMSPDMKAIVVFLFYSLIVWFFFSIMSFSTWSIGESLGREHFPKIFTALDSLFHKNFFTLNVANSALNGYFAGLTGLGIIAAAASALINGFDAKIAITGYDELMSASLPCLVPVLAAISTSLVSELSFRLFGNFFLFKVLGSKTAAIFGSSLLWTLFAISNWGLNVRLLPVYPVWLIYYIIGLFLGYLFWKTDLLTVIVANFFIVGVMQSLPLITSGDRGFFIHGLIALALLFLPFIVIFRGFVKKELFASQAELMPAHIRRITERVRMAKELEIAHRVQMKLLPAQSPKIEGAGIEGVCIPANEVGGDYYDFIPIDDNRMGIVIGDVSGKGVPAAIYMTLTKGIIQSHVENRFSPSEVLTKVNRSLYTMMDQKSFVTLFYAVIDLKKKRLVFSRAGHNPLLYFPGSEEQGQILKPKGIALGIDKGELFNGIIKEETIKLKKDDLLVFYTDGFSEAMNKDSAEYGEDRLVDVINRNKERSVKEIKEIVIGDVREFVNGCPQHDDMTMVLIKII
ncbi:MAG: SpoIIE family protein phosphatase [bacterium]|nr:SpoIIE family protein phosphatase [bacterium]